MRVLVTVLVLALAAGVNACRSAGNDPDSESSAAVASASPAVSHAEPAPAAQVEAPAAAVPTRVDFQTDVKPILEARCQPCHFPGGVMYERRPFDRPDTITALGTKLFSRLKDEEDRRVISEFLAQQAPAPPEH